MKNRQQILVLSKVGGLTAGIFITSPVLAEFSADIPPLMQLLFVKAGIGGGEGLRLWQKMEGTAPLLSRADFVGDSPSDRINDALRQ